MPVVAHSALPTFERLRKEGFAIEQPAANGAVRKLHIGLLNLMPDAALEATERQFIRLLAGAGSHADIYVHVFTVPEMPRAGKARALVDSHYLSIEDIESHGLDGSILTGANPANPELTASIFDNARHGAAGDRTCVCRIAFVKRRATRFEVNMAQAVVSSQPQLPRLVFMDRMDGSFQ